MSEKNKADILEYLSIVLFLGIVGGLILGIEKSWLFFREPLIPVVMDIIRTKVTLAIASAAVLVPTYLGLMSLLRQKGGNAFLSFSLSGIIVLPLFLVIGYRVNKNHLPELMTTSSLIGNLVLVLCFIALWFLVFRVVAPWVTARLTGKTRNRIFSRVPVFGGFLVVVLTLNLFPIFNGPSSSEVPQNVIIILIDALRADHLGSYGYERPTSPNIDAFARESVVFKQAISQSTFTKTSIASLFTGRYPYKHHVYWGILSQDEETLAEVMINAGYLTGAWVHNPHIRSYLGFDQGFTIYKDRGTSIDRINRDFLRWTDDYSADYKTFSYVHYLDLHDPYRPKAPYDTRYGTYSDIYADIDLKKWGKYLHKVREKEITLEQKDVDQVVAYYDGQINYIDDEIGKLFAELKSSGIYDGSLIIITADHGDGFMEHGFLSHSTTPYDELLRVPLIIKFPNSEHGGQVIEQQVCLVDVKPTMAGIAGIDVNNVDGQNLMNLIINGSTNGATVDFPKYTVSEIATTDGYPIVSVRSHRFKYIHFENKEDEFYNLQTDPLEQTNLITMENDISNEYETIALDVVNARSVIDSREKVKLDQETIRKLEALGYIK